MTVFLTIAGFLFLAFIVLVTADNNPEVFEAWLKPKTVIAVAAVAFICWQIYKARCAYEEKCSKTTATYERLTTKTK